MDIAVAIDKRAGGINKKIEVFIEVNIGGEASKSGVEGEYEIIRKLAEEISTLQCLQLKGLMTMGPQLGNPEDLRPYFRKIKDIFERIKALNLPNLKMETLSMGMSDTYRIAIEEGSNMVRLGRVVFGERHERSYYQKD